MRSLFFFRILTLVLSVSVLATFGCASTEEAKFYTLSPLAGSGMTAKTKSPGEGLAIGIGPIKLPEYLDRPQIVTRTSQNALDIAEFNLWAGSLVDDFSRILADNVSILLNSDRIIVYPWRKSVPIQYLVILEVTRFEGKRGGDVVLMARWTIFEGDKNKVLAMKKSSIQEPTGSSGYEAIVAAQSRALERMSREIADKIKNLSQ